MNIIKKVIDAKRWPEHTLVSSEDANSALDYIKEAVMTYVTEVEQALYAPRKTVLKAKEQRIAESPPVAGSETEPEPDFTGRVAELEAALKLAMDWLEDDVPKYIVDELINSLR